MRSGLLARSGVAGRQHHPVGIKTQSENLTCGEEAVITGDLMHHPCQMAHPEWCANVDSDTEQALDTRRDFLARYADTPTLVIGTHFAGPTAGRVVRDGEAYRLDS